MVIITLDSLTKFYQFLNQIIQIVLPFEPQKDFFSLADLIRTTLDAVTTYKTKELSNIYNTSSIKDYVRKTLCQTILSRRELS